MYMIYLFNFNFIFINVLWESEFEINYEFNINKVNKFGFCGIFFGLLVLLIFLFRNFEYSCILFF